jgi:predicted aspartyl protease
MARLVAGASLALPSHPRAQAAVPLHWRHTGDIGALMLTDVTLQGRILRVMIDTGASTAVVSPAIARELSLPVIDRVRVATLGGVQAAERVRVGELRVADAPAADGSALVLDLPALLGPALDGVDGLIGMPALRGSPCLFDLAQRRLQRGGAALSAMKGAERASLRFESGLPVIDLRLGDRDPAPFLFDTGNAGALVVFDHHAREMLADRPALPQTTVRELGGEVRAQYALVERLSGPGFSAREVPTAFEVGARARRGGHFDRLAGSLGSALFRTARIGLDAGDAPAWLLEAAAGPELPILPGGFGFALDGSRPPRVSAVIDGGPAARAGLAPGSRLVSVAGHRADDLRLHDVWQLLDGVDSTEFEWALAGGAARRVTLQRERFFPSFR